MGYMSHNAIIVSSVFDDKIEAAHKKAVEIFGDASRMVSPILGPVINGHRSFFVGPDGSKEGWEASDDGDRKREQFRVWLRDKCVEDGASYVDWAEVQYGNDDYETMITDDSDLDRRGAKFRKRACEALGVTGEASMSDVVDRVVEAMKWAQTQ